LGALAFEERGIGAGDTLNTKTLGLIGGIGPASTIDYYRLLVEQYRQQKQDGSYPSILINSIDLTRMLELVAGNRLPELTAYLLGEIERLARAGADVALVTSNTPHIVFDALSRGASIPLLSIVEAARDAAQDLGLERVGLLGTAFTMQGRFYQQVFAKAGITLLLPSADDQTYVHEKYMQELIPGNFRAETRERLLSIIGRLQQDGAEGVLLAGTELTLLLREVSDPGVPLLDTTLIHVSRAVKEMLGPALPPYQGSET
jgi:aspartate racemase